MHFIEFLPELEETERTRQVLGPPVLVNIFRSSTFQIIQDVTGNKPFFIAVAKEIAQFE